MVAAHAYDLRAAKKVYVRPACVYVLKTDSVASSGMKTVYIHGLTEDPDEDMNALRSDFDVFIDDTDKSPTCGIAALAGLAGA